MLLNLDNQNELIDDRSPLSGCSTWDSDDYDDSKGDDDAEDAVDVSLTPTQLLSLAIKKRRVLFSHKERDYRCELLHTALIQSLCKHLGESRANRRNLRKRRRGRRSRSPRQAKYAKCEYMDGESDTIMVSGSSELVGSGAVPPSAAATSFTDQIQFPTATPCLMELDKAAVMHGTSSVAMVSADDASQVDSQLNDNSDRYCFGGLDDPDPFGLDDLFTQMLTQQHQPRRNAVTSRG
uniref:Uncharacterized protein n=1 Tax=Plectus sambesii TaxID=2011161 RepID=A0A914V5P2_9BILA